MMKFKELEFGKLYVSNYDNLQFYFIPRIIDEFDGKLFVDSLTFYRNKNPAVIRVELNKQVFESADVVRIATIKEIVIIALKGLM